ncbi:SH3 domain-containing protein [Leptolyngbya sp. FACHB-17]|uniref:SH3 domain-containing protein n=2 Tax=unclassified Leptolyngbya TaxID=2650499 RepID=UPI0019AF9C97|nr:SH3 domain-containing protein [Leptolyngbya sp. FACHB-17]
MIRAIAIEADFTILLGFYTMLLHGSWSRLIGVITVLALVAGCSSTPQSQPNAQSNTATPSPSVSPSLPVSESSAPIAKSNTNDETSQPTPEPDTPRDTPTQGTRTVEKCIVLMARVNDPDSPLNVRSSPKATTTENIVGQLKNGTYVDVKEEQNGWFRISGETPGWIAKNRTDKTCGEKTERVQFGRGQDSIEIRDRFVGGGTHSYRFNLAKGQKMTLTSGSNRGELLPAVISPSGKSLISDLEQPSSWTGTLPETGDYTLQFDSNFKGYEYTFEVQVR